MDFAEVLELLERLALDLADPLARNVERAPDLLECARVLAADAVAQLEHAALAVGEVLERVAQGLLGEDLHGALVGRLGLFGGDELAELRILLGTDRLLERDRRLRGALDRVDLLGIDAAHLGDLLGRRLAAERRDQPALGATDLVELLDDVDGDPDRARLVSERTGDRLADPPGRVGRRLEALAIVELLRRADEADGALLNQVEKRQPLVAVVLGDRDHQPQVRLDQLLLGVESAALDPLGEIDLLLSAQQPHLADAPEEQLQRVGSPLRLEIQRGPAARALLGRALNAQARRNGWVDFLDQLDFRALEEAVQLLDVAFVETELGRGSFDLGGREHADLLAACDQTLDLVKLVKFRY